MTKPDARDGLAQARLERLHEQLAAPLLNYFARRVDPLEDAADLLSDTFLVAWRRIHQLPSDEEEARMWMFVTARGVLANWRRGQRRRSALASELRDSYQRAKRRLRHELEAVAVAIAPMPAAGARAGA